MPTAEITLTLRRPWHSQNQLDRLRHGRRAKYRQLMASLALELRQQLDSLDLSDQVFTQCTLLAQRYSTGELDESNAVGGLKAIQDVLVMQSSANPYGLGIIVDDRPDYLEAPVVEQIKLKRSESDQSRSELTLYGQLVARSEIEN